MFLVQMLLEKKDKKIEELANINEMRQLGLVCSEQMLEKDTQNFLRFFAEIKEETSNATKKYEQRKKEKNEKVTLLRNINDNCATITSKINKKLENLTQYNIYREFLEDLRPKDVKERMKAEKAAKVERRR